MFYPAYEAVMCMRLPSCKTLRFLLRARPAAEDPWYGTWCASCMLTTYPPQHRRETSSSF